MESREGRGLWSQESLKERRRGGEGQLKKKMKDLAHIKSPQQVGTAARG